MKNWSWAVAMLLVVGIGVGACKRAAQPPVGEPPAAGQAAPEQKTAPEMGAPAAGILPDEIAGALSKAVCGRMTECEKAKQQGQAQPPVSAEDCTNMMSKDLAQALPEKAKAINRDQLTTCVAAITKATCEELNAPTAPKGCEFMD
ncbi:MAG: hypothetical protein HYV03_08895 [Deltaproteobacteria bacterium]|nr:hypothetical protein [Deltaproteobacteria bacterium]